MKSVLVFLLLGAGAAPRAEAFAAGAAGAAGSVELHLTVGRSALVDFPQDIARISAGNPDVVDAVAASTREAMIHTRKVGNGTVVIWARTGARVVYHVAVHPDIEPLRKLVADSFPGENLQVHWTQDPEKRDALALTGTVEDPLVAERATALIAPFAKAVVNNIRVVNTRPAKQVLLRVRFAELNRSAASAFGVNLVSTGAANTPGAISTGQFPAPQAAELNGVIGGSASGTTSKFTITDVLNVFAFRPDLNLAAFIKALQTQGLLQILAEPTLVTVNGKEASFLVGGEFPVPVVQGGANAGAVTILFKEFGIRLKFTPLLMPHDTIRMHVQPEVSTIDQANSVTFQGFLIPALATRRMETNIELAARQSFLIGGLVDDRVTESLSKVPGLANIPLLGALFRSRQENKAKTELIVMVTPEITEPAQGLPAPPEMPKKTLEPMLFPAGGGRRK